MNALKLTAYAFSDVYVVDGMYYVRRDIPIGREVIIAHADDKVYVITESRIEISDDSIVESLPHGDFPVGGMNG